jgi:hypothetical protein
MSAQAKIAAAVLGCAVVAGGAFAATEALSSPNAPQASGSSVSQGAILSGAIADTTASPSGTASTPAQQKAATRRARAALRRLRLIGGEHGEVTFGTKKGARTLAFERGTVVSVAGSDVTVRAKDGTTWTWTLAGNPVVREDGKSEASSALQAGQTVFTAGQAVSTGSGTTRDARLTVIQQKKS